MKERFGFRDVSPSDIPFVREIDHLSFGADDQYPDEFYHSLVHSELRTIIAATPAGDIAGYALLELGRKPIRLRSIATHPEHRRKGCAEFLIRHILEVFGLPIELLVKKENVRAIRLYQRLGFKYLHRPADAELAESSFMFVLS